MSNTLIVGANVWDATGEPAFKGDVLVEGNKIRAVSRVSGQLSHSDCETIDGTGMFLMPGMTEGHAHLSFENVSATEDLITPSPEEHALITARGAKLLIDAGFTSSYGASEAKLRLAVAVRNQEVSAAGTRRQHRMREGVRQLSISEDLADDDTVQPTEANVARAEEIDVEG